MIDRISMADGLGYPSSSTKIETATAAPVRPEPSAVPASKHAWTLIVRTARLSWGIAIKSKEVLRTLGGGQVL